MNQAKSTKQQIQHSLGPRFLNSTWTCVLSKKKKRTHTCITGYWKIGGLHSNNQIFLVWKLGSTQTYIGLQRHVFVVQYILALIFFFLYKTSRTNQSLQICLCFWHLEKQVLKLMCENPLVCVVMTDGCTAWLWLPNSTVPSKYESYFEFCFLEYYFSAFQHKHITKANHIN